ncbi:cupin domain-containing protein [Roseomonas sp. NAR14]|uniref:Cupin domain-containing protein n=1 Tax=Roseomonas acroporae TaxID=2937791 RepID=A0A9X1Y499_9PROT|nr:cupin domain-containing protein [Roseomonas acroporae]
MTCREPAVPTLQVENEHVRVTRWDFPPGSETGWHRHGFSYVVVPVIAGTMHVELPGGGTTTVEITPGVSYARDFGVEHNVVNAGTAPFAFVEVELKALAG